jgi:SAM-dependent methyltransferase
MERDTLERPSYSPEHFAPLFEAEDNHFWFRSRNRCIAQVLRSLNGFGSVRDVLEIGCGTGVVLAELQRLFPASNVVGVDLFEEGLEFAKRRFQGTLLHGNIFEMSFDRLFDVIGAFDVIEHLDEDEKLLRVLWRLVRPGGHLILTVPAHQNLWSYFDEAAGHRRRYSVADLSRKLKWAGFTGVFVTQFMGALFPAMWIKRRFLGETATRLSAASAERQQAAVQSDLQVNPVLNRIFEVLLWPESHLVSRRIRLPLGTSLIAVAQRPNPNSDPES